MRRNLGDFVPIPTGSGPRPLALSRPALLPDSMLPLALQRSNPLLRFTTHVPNAWDARIMREAAAWRWIAMHGGLKSCCRIAELGAPIYDQPPWEVMPSNGIPFQKMFSLPIASVSGGGGFDGSDTTLGSFRVPAGYDGVINRFVCQFTGTGFDDFSGNIFWRLLVGVRFARNLGNVANTFGSYQTAFMVPGTDNIRLVSNQTISVIASIPNGSPVSGGFVTGGAFGWFYPRR